MDSSSYHHKGRLSSHGRTREGGQKDTERCLRSGADVSTSYNHCCAWTASPRRGLAETEHRGSLWSWTGGGQGRSGLLSMTRLVLSVMELDYQYTTNNTLNFYSSDIMYLGRRSALCIRIRSDSSNISTGSYLWPPRVLHSSRTLLTRAARPKKST